MKFLYAPWRNKYATSITEAKKETTQESACVFCTINKEKDHDREHFVLRRFNHHYIMFNRYPYNAGHLLVISYKHTGLLEELTQEARAELMELTTKSLSILKQQINADGFNVGLNLGKAGGAGIPSHLHVHVLPRFIGDTNFLPTIGETKQISFDLNKIYEQLKPEFDRL